VIGDTAFSENQLTSVTLPDNVNIDNYSFPYYYIYEQYIKNGKKKRTFSISQRTAVNDYEIVIIDNAVVEILKYNGNEKDVNIPEKINGLPVTVIETSAFIKKQLTSVTIPGSVTTIGKKAFSTDLLTSVTLPDNVNIDIYSFSYYSIYDQYYSIYDQYVKNGKKKHTFTISQPSAVNDYEIVIIDNAVVEILKYNGKEKNINIPEKINGLPVTVIRTKAFEKKQLTGVTIPNSVTVIGNYAFENNLLTSVTIPNSVTLIGDNAFSKNRLTGVSVPNSVTVINSGAFSENQLTGVNIPSSVTVIESGAFAGNRLTSVIIPNSVTTIGYYAFRKNQLTSVNIPASVTSIGDWAFYDNEKLTSVTLPDNVNMQIYSFPYYYIYEQYIKNGKKNRTFSISQRTTVNAYEIVVLDNAFVTILKYVGSEKNVKIPEKINGLPVTAIEDSAFYKKELTSVTIPNSVTVIGNWAFYGNKLTGVTIPNTVTTIGEDAFSENQLTSVIIPNSVTVIGESAFYRNQLTSVTVPDSVNIKQYAFWYNNLTSITIGANVILARMAFGLIENIYKNGGNRAVKLTRTDTNTDTWTVEYR
ncbi:leucine-rich repeat domain-containing protein, partial [Treponema sp. R80B11-R83G3]